LGRTDGEPWPQLGEDSIQQLLAATARGEVILTCRTAGCRRKQLVAHSVTPRRVKPQQPSPTRRGEYSAPSRAAISSRSTRFDQWSSIAAVWWCADRPGHRSFGAAAARAPR